MLLIMHVLTLWVFTREERDGDTEFSPLTTHIDNATVVKLNKGKARQLHLKDFGVPEYNLWTLTSELQRLLVIPLKTEWVKAHQDNNVVDVGDLPFEAQINVSADSFASSALRANNGVAPGPKPFLHTCVSGYYSQAGREIHDLQPYLYKTIHREKSLTITLQITGGIGPSIPRCVG